MKQLFILVFIIIAATTVFSQDKRPDWQSPRLKGKVKEQIEFDYYISYEFDTMVKKISSKHIYKYDDKGNMTEDTEYEGNKDKASTKRIYKYDGKGNRIEQACYGLRGLYYKYIYKYDDRCNMVECFIYDADWPKPNKENYKYDNNGNIIEKTSDKLAYNYEKYKYEYDNKKNIIEQLTYKSDNSITMKCIHKYSDNGNRIETTNYGADGTYYGRTRYLYDDKGNMTESISHDKDNILSSRDMYKYVYDNKGNMTEKATYEVKTKFGQNIEEMTHFSEWQYTYY